MTEKEKEEKLLRLKQAKEAINLSVSYTLSDVEEQEKEEEKSRGGFVKIPYFSMSKAGTYTLRILPLKPKEGASEDDMKKDFEAGWALPIRKCNLNVMSKSGKKYFVSVTQPEYAGISGDLVRVFRKLVREASENLKRPELAKEIDHHERGIKYKSRRLAYILDDDDRKNEDGTPKIKSWEMSYTQWKSLHDQNKIAWKENTDDGELDLCPISRPEDACNVKIKREGAGLDTKYTVSLTRKANDTLSVDEMLAWLDLPTIREHFYVYTRYQFEATLACMEQWELDNDVEITTHPEFIAEKERIEAQLPASDQSHFDAAGSEVNGSGDDLANDKVSLDDLFGELDRIEDEGLDAKESDEAGMLRSNIQKFIVENELSDLVTMSPLKTNEDVLDEIVDAIETKNSQSRASNRASRRRRR